MDISGLTEQEKSVMLAKAMGWEVTALNQILLPVPEEFDWFDISIQAPNIANDTLYDMQNMALAWKVLNWLNKQDNMELYWGFFDWWQDTYSIEDFTSLTNEQAQAAWLDKILELALAADLVPLPDAEDGDG